MTSKSVKMKRHLLVICFLSVSTTPSSGTTTTSVNDGTCLPDLYGFANAIDKSLLFYEAQRSGDLPEAEMRVKWRKDSALDDQGFNGEDLSGGYYDGKFFLFRACLLGSGHLPASRLACQGACLPGGLPARGLACQEACLPGGLPARGLDCQGPYLPGPGRGLASWGTSTDPLLAGCLPGAMLAGRLLYTWLSY
jgi:hypothetical protein